MKLTHECIEGIDLGLAGVDLFQVCNKSNQIMHRSFLTSVLANSVMAGRSDFVMHLIDLYDQPCPVMFTSPPHPASPPPPTSLSNPPPAAKGRKGKKRKTEKKEKHVNGMLCVIFDPYK